MNASIVGMLLSLGIAAAMLLSAVGCNNDGGAGVVPANSEGKQTVHSPAVGEHSQFPSPVARLAGPMPQGVSSKQPFPNAASVRPLEENTPDFAGAAVDDNTSILEGAGKADAALFHKSVVADAVGTTRGSQEGTSTVEEILESGLRLAGASPVHLVFRGTPVSDTVRCEWRGIARTMEQRKTAILYWLKLGEDEELPDRVLLEALFAVALDVVDPEYRETAKSNFMAIARGGLSDEYQFLACFADYAVAEYVLGSGPGTITVAYDRIDEAASYGLYTRGHESGQFGNDPLQTRGEYENSLFTLVANAEESVSQRIGSAEAIIFLSPMGAHNTIAVEAWQAVAQWDLQTDDQGIVQAVRYGTYAGDPEYTQTLANLKSRIATAGASDAHAGQRIANVSGLSQYYRDMGAYEDITPDDASTRTFTPAQPRPVPPCANGIAVADPSVNRALVNDCETLLELKDTLAGTAVLNWSADLAMGSWIGVTTSGTPQRVTGVSLPSSSLSGTIPTELGTLWSLETLDLSSNSLTGSIPAALGGLPELGTLRLSGNTFSGCIPAALRNVATIDLTMLNLLYCDMLPLPAAPGNLSVSLAGDVFTIGWDAVSGAARYEAQHRASETDDWTALPETDSTNATYTPEGAPACETTYQFRVRSYGNGITLRADWGTESKSETHETESCNAAPEFDSDTYSFTVDESTLTGTVIGTVAAADSDDGDVVSYSITTGDEDAKFAIAEDTGVITLSAALDYLSSSSHALTVRAEDGNGGENTAQVEVTVSSVCRNGTVIQDPGDNPDQVGDCLILYGARDVLAGSASLDWSGDAALADWSGVEPRRYSGRVGQMGLSDLGLDGVIPPSLAGLSQLQQLDLSENQLTGGIPAELGNLGFLTYLDLTDNQLAEDIPAALGDLGELQQLKLRGNQLTGGIPAELGNLASLIYLDLSDNLLDGGLPATLGDLTHLRQIRLSKNQLSGEIPAGLGGLPSLTHIYIYYNLLEGEIPAELGNLTELRHLRLDVNRLTGNIPSELGGLEQLEQLLLDTNQLNGSIPEELGDMPALVELRVNNNRLSGSIPVRMGSPGSGAPVPVRQFIHWLPAIRASGRAQ